MRDDRAGAVSIPAAAAGLTIHANRAGRRVAWPTWPSGSSPQPNAATRRRNCPPGARATRRAADPRRDATSTGSPPRSRRCARRPSVLHRLARRPRRADARRRPDDRRLFCAAAERGVVVKGLMWRSHLDKFQYSEEENRHLGEAIEAAGGEVLLDQRVRLGGSHHQKLVVLRHPGRAGARRRIRRRHRPVPLPPRRRLAPRRPAGGADVQALRRASAVARRAAAVAGPGRRRAGRHLPGTLERPGTAGHAVTDRLDRGQAAPRRPHTGPAAGPAARIRRRAGRTPCRCCAPTPTRTSIRLRTARRTQHRPRLHQGDPPGPAADLPGGPVPVVRGRLPTCSPGR